MLPPIEDSVLRNNPKFAVLHGLLAGQILNPSGSTKHHPAQKERDATTEDLRKARVKAAKRHLIRTSISNLDLSPIITTTTIKPTTSKPRPKPTSTTTPLPTELIELILLLTSHLTTTTSTLTPQSLHLLHHTPQYNSLPTHLPTISHLLSTYLQTLTTSLSRILTPKTNASYIHLTIPNLYTTLLALKTSIQTLTTTLTTRRTYLTTQTTTLLSALHTTATTLIHILESSKHGSISRHIRTKTDYLALHAEEVSLEVREKAIRGERALYSDEVRTALGNYLQELKGGRERLGERRRGAERVLRGYGVGREDGGKERVMREIARVYGDLGREVGEVGRDVERLGGG